MKKSRQDLLNELSEKRFYDSQEVRTMLGVSLQTVRRAIEAGHIKIVKIGRFVRIPAAEVQRLLAGEEVLNIEEASKVLGIQMKTIRDLVMAGSIKAMRIAGKGQYRIYKSEIERLMREGVTRND